MMGKVNPIKVGIFSRIGDSPVLNEIATLETTAKVEAITDETRRPGDAPDATQRLYFDLAPLLRRAADQVDEPRRYGGSAYIDIVFDGPPANESGRFIEVEDETGAGIRVGEWIDRGNGLWALRIPRNKLAQGGIVAGGLIADVAGIPGHPGNAPGPTFDAGAIQIHGVDEPSAIAGEVAASINRMRDHRAQMRQADRP